MATQRVTIPTWSPDALRDVLRRADLTGDATAALLGVTGRTVRRWTETPGTPSSREMPAPAWRLLLLITGNITCDQIRTLAPQRSARDTWQPAGNAHA